MCQGSIISALSFWVHGNSTIAGLGRNTGCDLECL